MAKLVKAHISVAGLRAGTTGMIDDKFADMLEKKGYVSFADKLSTRDPKLAVDSAQSPTSVEMPKVDEKNASNQSGGSIDEKG